MQFLKCVKIALLVSGAVFAVTSLPAAKFASERIDIQLNRSQVFSGEMRDLSSAYLAIAGFMSASLGLTGFSLAAWRQTGSHLKATKRTVRELEALIKQREQQLQVAQLAPARLQQSGLDAFMDDDFCLGAAPSAQHQASPFNKTVASRGISTAEPASPPAVIQAARLMTSEHRTLERQLSPSHAFQLQAIQAQLEQQHRQVQQPTAAHRKTMHSSGGGFTVINPYQVQSITQPSRRMA